MCVCFVVVFPESVKRTAKLVQIVYPPLPNSVKSVFEVGPAIFGPDLGVDISDLSGELFVLPGEQETEVGDGCQVVSEELHAQCLKKVVMVSRGGCLFIQKVCKWGERDVLLGGARWGGGGGGGSGGEEVGGGGGGSGGEEVGGGGVEGRRWGGGSGGEEVGGGGGGREWEERGQ